MTQIIGFQGMRGAYSELAALQYFGKNALHRLRPMAHFEEVFRALKKNLISDALLPFENSLAGTIYENYDHLARYPVEIKGETILQINHCLLAPKGLSLKNIKTVISHPQALAQCSGFLKEKKYAVQNYFDTAGAAFDLASKKTFTQTAAIASEQAAKRYSLQILAKNIADRGENYTRFLHLTRKARTPSTLQRKNTKVPRVLSLILVHSGDGFARIAPLCGILQSLGIELMHCEARPTKDAAWTYNYYLEVAAGPDHPSWNTALLALSAMTRYLRILGTYPSTRFEKLQ